jgi:hypothetical protein
MNFALLHSKIDVIIGQNQGELFGNPTHVNGIIRHGSDSLPEG